MVFDNSGLKLLKYNSADHTSFKDVFVNLGYQEEEFNFNYTKQELELLGQLKKIYLKCCRTLKKSNLEAAELILLKFNGAYDGHSLQLGNRIVCFLDLTTYMSHLDQPNFDQYSHLLHEMIHAAHYKLFYYKYN